MNPCWCNRTEFVPTPDGRPDIYCDPCIATIIKVLNDAGIRTVASCCGHLVRPASIALEDGREILIMPLEEARKLDSLWRPIYEEHGGKALARNILFSALAALNHEGG